MQQSDQSFLGGTKLRNLYEQRQHVGEILKGNKVLLKKNVWWTQSQWHQSQKQYFLLISLHISQSTCHSGLDIHGLSDLIPAFFPYSVWKIDKEPWRKGSSPYFSNDFFWHLQDSCPHSPLKSDFSKQRAQAHPAQVLQWPLPRKSCPSQSSARQGSLLLSSLACL